MNNIGKPTDYEAKGLVEIESIVPLNVLSKAKEYRDLLKSLTFEQKNITGDNRSEEDLEIDAKAAELITELGTGSNIALAYGWMLYDEAAIAKTYWAYRVGKLRQDKREFFNKDLYLEWITDIFEVLTGEHPNFHDPLYYYKIGGNSKGRTVGYYDIVNSFRTYWNRNFLSNLAIELFKRDKKAAESGISIEAALENENGAGGYMEADLAKNNKLAYEDSKLADFLLVEDFLKAFLQPPLNGPVPLNKTTKGYGITYLQSLQAIVDGTWNSGKAAYEKFSIGPSVRDLILSKIKSEMKRFDINLEIFAGYLEAYRPVAIKILNGDVDATFSKEI